MTKSCDNCKFYTCGTIYKYLWQDCTKNWSEKQRPFIGVIKHLCGNYQEKK